MNALRFLLSLPFRLVMFVSGCLAVAFVIVGTGAAVVADAFGGDRS